MLTVAGQGQGESQVPPCSRGALAALRAVLWRKDPPASAQRLAGLQPPDGIEAHCFALVVFTFLISSHSGWISMWNLTKSFMSGLAMQLSGRAWARPWVPSSAPSIKKRKWPILKESFYIQSIRWGWREGSVVNSPTALVFPEPSGASQPPVTPPRSGLCRHLHMMQVHIPKNKIKYFKNHTNPMSGGCFVLVFLGSGWFF